MIEILPFKGTLSQFVDIPGSKYLANRALIIAALAKGKSRLFNVPYNDDIDTAILGLKQFGVEVSRKGATVFVHGLNGHPALPYADIYTSASGTFSRFIISLGSLVVGETRYYGTPKMNSRPMKDLIQSLENLGVEIKHRDFHMPLTIKGPLVGGRTKLNGKVSSQYLSSLLLCSPFAHQAVDIELVGDLVSLPYVKMTIDLMRYFGVHVDNYDYRRFVIRPGHAYQARDLVIESDPVSSSYFLGAAALLGQKVTIRHFNAKAAQGESQFAEVLLQMGCKNHVGLDSITIEGPRQLKAVKVDMGNMPDVVQTLTVLAAFAKGVTHIKNIAHLKHKESNRISDTAQELQKLGILVKATEDSLTITGGFPKGAIIETHEDHRMAMSFALAGLKIPGVKIKKPHVVAKSFPSFWETLKNCGVEIKHT